MRVRRWVLMMLASVVIGVVLSPTSQVSAAEEGPEWPRYKHFNIYTGTSWCGPESCGPVHPDYFCLYCCMNPGECAS